MKNALLAFLLLSLVGFSSCGGDDTPEPMEMEELPPMSMTFSYNDTTNTITDTDLVDASVSNLTIYGTKVRTWSCNIELDDGDEFLITVQNIRELESTGGFRVKTYDTAPIDCETTDGVGVCEEGAVEIILVDGLIRTDIQDPVGSLTVTANDASKKIMSGSFSMQVRRFGSIDPLQTLEGTFENIPYYSF